MDVDAGLIAAAAVNPICLWCEGGFDIRKGGGAPQRFCQPKCRDSFHSAGRRWAEMAVLSGVITVGDLRNVSGAPCTLAGRVEGASDYRGLGSDENPAPARANASEFWLAALYRTRGVGCRFRGERYVALVALATAGFFLSAGDIAFRAA